MSAITRTEQLSRYNRDYAEWRTKNGNASAGDIEDAKQRISNYYPDLVHVPTPPDVQTPGEPLKITIGGGSVHAKGINEEAQERMIVSMGEAEQAQIREAADKAALQTALEEEAAELGIASPPAEVTVPATTGNPVVDKPQPPYPPGYWDDLPDTSDDGIVVETGTTLTDEQIAVTTANRARTLESIAADEIEAKQKEYDSPENIDLRKKAAAIKAKDEHVDELKAKGVDPEAVGNGETTDADLVNPQPPKNYAATGGNDFGNAYFAPSVETGDDFANFPVTQEKTNLRAAAGVHGKTPTPLPTHIDTKPNILDQYATYTYNIALYALDAKAFNTMIESRDRRKLQKMSKNLLIKSGGVGNGNPIFGEDFYIDDFEMDTIAPTTQFTKGTTSVNIKFKIVEPYGMSLIERLIDVATDLIGVGDPKQYTQIPYMIHISFIGYDEEGIAHKVKADRYFPINIWELKFEANAGGAQYSVQAVPYSHQAYASKIETIPQPMELSANKIKDLLLAGKTGATTYQKPREEKIFKNVGPGGAGRKVQSGVKKISAKRGVPGSIIDMLNSRQQEISGHSPTYLPDGSKVHPLQTFADTYEIDMRDPEMLEAELNYTAFDPNNVVTSKHKNVLGFYDNFLKSAKGKFTIDKKAGTAMRIETSTSLVDLIGIILVHSSYIHNQTPEKPASDGTAPEFKTLKWFKITPVITIKENQWDPQRQRYAYNIKYIISAYRVNNTQIQSTKHSVPRGYVSGDGYHKEYNYMYTGLNTDVLDFDIKYNLAYHTVGNASSRGEDGSPLTGNTGNGANSTAVHQSTNADVTGNSTLSKKGAGGKHNLGHDLAKNVMTNGVDLFNLNLSILGDPGWITQADMYDVAHLYDPKLDKAFLEDGGEGIVNMDYSEMYCRMNFRSPVDYSDNGLMDFTGDQKYNRSTVFGGVYQVWKVKTELSGGVFTQTLHGIRIIPQNDGVVQKKSTQRVNKKSRGQDSDRSTGKFSVSPPPVNKIKVPVVKVVKEAVTPLIGRGSHRAEISEADFNRNQMALKASGNL